MEKSQITIQSHQITIHSESGFTNKVKFFGSDLITMILGISLFLSLLFYFVAVAFFLILLILNRLIRRLPTNIIITKTQTTQRPDIATTLFISQQAATTTTTCNGRCFRPCSETKTGGKPRPRRPPSHMFGTRAHF